MLSGKELVSRDQRNFFVIVLGELEGLGRPGKFGLESIGEKTLCEPYTLFLSDAPGRGQRHKANDIL